MIGSFNSGCVPGKLTAWQPPEVLTFDLVILLVLVEVVSITWSENVEIADLVVYLAELEAGQVVVQVLRSTMRSK